jgi:hypothetical protein
MAFSSVMITANPGVAVGNGPASLDDGADILSGQAALEHVAFEFEVKLGQADLPPAHVEADAHDPDHDPDQRDQGDLGDGHEPGVFGKDFEHDRVSHWGRVKIRQSIRRLRRILAPIHGAHAWGGCYSPDFTRPLIRSPSDSSAELID